MTENMSEDKPVPPPGPDPQRNGVVAGASKNPERLTLSDFLLQAPDKQFSEELPRLVRQHSLSPVWDVLEHPGILAKLTLLADPLFTNTIVALARPDSVGLEILFDERLLARYAQIGRSHLRGVFLPTLRTFRGFRETDWLYDIRHAPM